MTQFGRLVPMLKLDMPACRIVEETHFSLGGASGGAGKAGEANPMEYHALGPPATLGTSSKAKPISQKTSLPRANEMAGR